ncbi:MAG1360 family OppF-related protein [Mycoplasmopsis cricetuli]|uniref:MAG1360 family OppF-related protein n=1 Tax=Mycoplasmopsis cricetuli TaxID=171283 RepID=UPI0012ECA6A5|nr:hypothetical protein [Mycoplasmopsis cricetuli]
MSQEKLLLSLDNILNSSFKDGNHHFLNIPKINIYLNNPTVFFIDKEYNNFSFDEFWKTIINKKEFNISMFLDNDNGNFINVVTDKNEIKKHLVFLNLKEIFDGNDKDLAFFKLWKQSLVSDSEQEEYILKLEQMINDFEISTKSFFFNLLVGSSDKIIELNNGLLSKLSILSSKLRSNSKYITEKEIITFLKEFNNYALKYQINLFECYLELFKGIVSRYHLYISHKPLSNSYIQKQAINEYKLELKYANKISATSLQKVENDIDISNLEKEISFLEEYKQKKIIESKKIIQLIKKKIKKKINLLKEEKNNKSNKNLNKKQAQRSIFYNRAILKCWQKNKKFLKYVSFEKLQELNEIIENEQNFFAFDDWNKLSNINFLQKIILEKEIKKDFDEKASSFYKNSLKNEQKINLEIKQANYDLKINLKKNFKQIEGLKNTFKIKKLEDKIKLAEADLEWTNYSEERLYNKALNNSFTKIKTLNKNIKRTLKESTQYFKFFINFTDSKNLFKEIKWSNEYVKFENFFTQFIDLDLFNNLIFLLSDFILNKNKDHTKFIYYFIGLIKFIDVINYLSLDTSVYFTQYKYLTNDEQTKLKIVNLFLNKTKTIFINDNLENSNYQLKINFLKTLKQITKAYNLTYVFFTEDLQFSIDNFTDIHFFFNNTLIEGGKLKEVLKSPINPFTKKIISRSIEKFIDLETEKINFFTGRIININHSKKHYIYASYKDYQKWTNSIISPSKILNDNTENLLNIKINTNDKSQLKNYLNLKEFIITNPEDFANLKFKKIPSDFNKKISTKFHEELKNKENY